MTNQTPQTENEDAGWQSRTGEAGANLTAVLGVPVVERDDFLAGVCVSLQVITAMDCGVTWAEIVRAVGEDKIIRYASHIEPEEWELAGFKKYAMQELRRGKPRKVPNAKVSGASDDQ